MTRASEEPPVTVLARAKHPGESLTYLILRSEPTIWTERMLTALLEGVKGGKWYSLMDAQLPDHVQGSRRLDTDEATKHPPETARSEGTRSWQRPYTLEDRLLCGARAV
jgi:hypothetical protein